MDRGNRMISEELLQSFIAEASDLLDDIEPSLVEYSRLEEPEERMEIVNRVFRHFHSIKGSAGFVGLHDIARLTHEAETLLEQFRKAPGKTISQENINLLCRTVDLLRVIFDSGGDEDHKAQDGAGIDSLINEIANAIRLIKGASPRGLTAISLYREDGAKASETLNLKPASGDDTVTVLAGPIEGSKTRNVTKASRKKNSPAPGETKSAGKRAKTDSITAEKADPESVTRTRRPTGSDTARIIRAGTARTARQEKMPTAEFAGKYVAEANELIEQIEQSLLQAEQHPESGGDAIQEALRCLHSFKGNSGFMNLSDLERLSHRMESEVEKTAGRSLGLDSQTFDALLQMIDVLRQGVLDYSCGGSGAIPEVDAYIAMMDEFSAHSGGRAAPGAPTKALSASSAPVSVPADPLPITAETRKPSQPQSSGTEVIGGKRREDAKPVTPQSTGRDTTRLVLRGDVSQQEDLASRPKAGRIDIAAPPPPEKPTRPETANQINPETETKTIVGQPPSVQPRPQPKADTPPTPERRPEKQSDTGQKKRTIEQLASRNDIRVDLRKLDAMLDLVGELVIAEAMVTRHPVVWNAENESLERAVHQLRRVASSLQDMATSVRMIPLAPTFRRMTRLVYDLSAKAGKQVDLILLGEETEVDRTVIERISDPLVHIIRNAIDHGIEPAEERLALGKPETGRLTIEGHHEGGEVWIVITDDGRGLDREAILNKAISRGLVACDGSDLTDNQIFHFIFEPGFSTAAKVTDISGRGFGMDVVKKNIEKLSGKIDIRTRPGEGTAMVLRIPLTLAIIDGMLVRSGNTRYIIPLLSIRESLKPEMGQLLSTPDGQELVKLRDELIPIVKLDETFTRVKADRSLLDGILMIVEGEDGDVVALFADELLGQQETVIKGLSGWLKRSRGVSGCTILGDGEVGLILDIGAIVRIARRKNSA